MSSIWNFHSRLDIYGFFFYVGAQFVPQRLFRHQIDRATERVLQNKLHTEIPLGGSRPIESNHDIHVDIRTRLIAGGLGRSVPDNRNIVRIRFNMHIF